jgi:hypothetical protein
MEWKFISAKLGGGSKGKNFHVDSRKKPREWKNPALTEAANEMKRFHL